MVIMAHHISLFNRSQILNRWDLFDFQLHAANDPTDFQPTEKKNACQQIFFINLCYKNLNFKFFFITPTDPRKSMSRRSEKIKINYVWRKSHDCNQISAYFSVLTKKLKLTLIKDNTNSQIFQLYDLDAMIG